MYTPATNPKGPPMQKNTNFSNPNAKGSGSMKTGNKSFANPNAHGSGSMKPGAKGKVAETIKGKPC